MKTVLPYNLKHKSKKEQVTNMFDNIAHSYDFLNNFLSLNIDRIWRKKSLRLLKQKCEDKQNIVLDIASGTGDFAFECIHILCPKKVIGIDISKNMLDIAEAKAVKKHVKEIYETRVCDAEALPFESQCIDTAIVAFGVRNFESLTKGLEEIHRVLKQGGTLLILEFSKPHNIWVRKLYHFYLHHYIPTMGKLISKDKFAYNYLGKSVDEFPHGKAFCKILEDVAFKNIEHHPLSFGISTAYLSNK